MFAVLEVENQDLSIFVCSLESLRVELKMGRKKPGPTLPFRPWGVLRVRWGIDCHLAPLTLNSTLIVEVDHPPWKSDLTEAKPVFFLLCFYIWV